MIEKEFTPYEQALALKELGFDEECFSTWIERDKRDSGGIVLEMWGNEDTEYSLISEILAPTFSQAFRFFREKYELLNHLTSHLNPYGEDGALEESYGYRVMRNNDGWKCSVWEELSFFDTYEESELECLKKLIEICKKL